MTTTTYAADHTALLIDDPCGDFMSKGGKYMGKLEEKIALVTGGTSGVGLATSKQFVNEGAYVFITGRRDPELAAEERNFTEKCAAVKDRAVV